MVCYDVDQFHLVSHTAIAVQSKNTARVQRRLIGILKYTEETTSKQDQYTIWEPHKINIKYVFFNYILLDKVLFILKYNIFFLFSEYVRNIETD